MAVNFSIIICSYNPNPKIFKRLLRAIKSFGADNLSGCEVVLVDNNSTPALIEDNSIKEFLALLPSTVSIREKASGLTHARIAGVNATKNEWLIFFDDDNEPFPDYLLKAEEAIKLNPKVGCWGPGKIQVEFIGAVNDEWILTQRHFFQERQSFNVDYDNKKEWQSCYPFGTGLIVRRDILIEYISRVEKKQYTLSDRKGKSLSSGGDVQIVLTGISLGYYAGVSPTIALNHLIDSNKASTNYISKLIYGTASAYLLAYNQVFPSDLIKADNVSSFQVIERVYAMCRIHYRKNINKNDFLVLLTKRLGEINAHHLVVGRKSLVIRAFERLLYV